jgi:hypothetical protein
MYFKCLVDVFGMFWGVSAMRLRFVGSCLVVRIWNVVGRVFGMCLGCFGPCLECIWAVVMCIWDYCVLAFCSNRRNVCVVAARDVNTACWSDVGVCNESLDALLAGCLQMTRVHLTLVEKWKTS